MNRTSDLRILFPTNFSDACFRTLRAIAQLADTCHISVTIAHVTKPGKATVGTRRELDSFLAEADHYDSCRRVLIESDDPVSAIVGLCERERFDILAAPASDRLGIQRFFSPSLRARLLKLCPVPLWTAGACLDRVVSRHELRTVACLLDFDCPADPHLTLAASLAWRTGARLRVVTVVPPTHEGTLARSIDSRAPLMPDVALEAIRRAFDGSQACPEADVAIGTTAEALPRMLASCEADLAFVGPGQALGGILAARLEPWLDRLPCPVICVDGASASFDRWSFETRAYVPSRDHAIAS